MLNKNAAATHRVNGQHRHEEVTVNVGTGAFSRGHKIQKLYGLAANLFRDNKLAEPGTAVRPKDTMPKLDEDGEPVFQKGTRDVVSRAEPNVQSRTGRL